MVASPPRHFLQFSDFSRDELDHLFERTRWIKTRFKQYELYQPLRDRTLAMVFEKASTRTRVSFEAGMNQLGGIAINLTRGDTQLSRGEPIEDVARVVSRMVDVVMIRTFEQAIIERFAAHSRVPVINGLTNEYHPCQILADIYTYVEHRGSIRGRAVATNTPPNGAFRGFGAPQTEFAAEMQVNRIAERLGIDPLELRRRWAYVEDDVTPTGQVLSESVAAHEVLDRRDHMIDTVLIPDNSDISEHEFFASPDGNVGGDPPDS